MYLLMNQFIAGDTRLIRALITKFNSTVWILSYYGGHTILNWVFYIDNPREQGSMQL